MTLNSGCAAKIGKFLIQSKSTFVSNQTYLIEDHKELLDLRTISNMKMKIALDKLGLSLNNNSFGSDFNQTNVFHLHSLDLLEKLENQRKQVNESKMKQTIQLDLQQTKIFNYVLSVLVGIMIVIVLVFGCYCLRLRCKNMVMKTETEMKNMEIKYKDGHYFGPSAPAIK